MRTVSAPERTLLGSGAVEFHKRLEVQNGSGTWKDLTALNGIDWVTSVRVEETVDTRLMNITVECQARHGALSLNPLMASSVLNRNDADVYSPLLNPGRGIRLSEAVTAPGAPPVTWHQIFEGVIDEPESSNDGEKITITGRDIGRWLADVIVERADLFYSDEAGQPVETIIQQIMDDHAGVNSPVMVMPGGSPGWNIRKFTLARVTIMDAVVALSDQIGWDQRMRYPPVGDTLQWQLRDVDRTNTVADFTLPPDEYLAVNSLKFSDRDIRNVVRVYFSDRLNGGATAYAEAIDLASIGALGGIRRYLEVTEDAASNIDTMVEAQKMADAMLSDLSTPIADHSIESFHLWFVQLGDLIDFPANSVHYDSTQKYAVVSITRTWEEGKTRITLLTRGKVTGQYLAWLKKHGRGRFIEDQIPRPIFGQPIGEDSEGGGVSGDGMVWLDAQFDINTKEIRVYAEEAEHEYPLVPDISEITKAWAIPRPEGTETSKDDFATMLGMATRPFWYKRLRAFGVNADGVPGPETIFEVVQAIDVVSVLDGEVTDLRLTQGVDNTLNIDVGNTDPVVPSWLMVMRNGIIIRKIFLGFQNNVTIQVVDSGIRVTTRYTYEAFVWTQGVSGAHFINTDLTGTGNFANFPLPGKLKITAMQVMTHGAGPALRIDYKANVIGFADAVLEESDDDGVGDPWVASAVLSQTITPFNGSFWVSNIATARYYRIRVDKWDGTFIYSPSMLWNTVNIPPPAGPSPVPQFVNGTPRLVYLTLSPVVEIEYDISATAFTSMRLETSADGIIGWTQIDSATAQHGLFYDTNTSAKYYRLRAVGGATDLYSQPVLFQGAKTKPGGTTPGAAPVFTLSIQHTLQNGINFPVLRISWTCINSLAVEVTIERSVDDGVVDPWIEVRRDANVAQGYWDTSVTDAYFYRMKAKDAADVTLATSASQEHDPLIYFP